MCTRRGVSIPSTRVACAGFVGAATWTADFAQSDGPPEGWGVTQPDVTVQSEVLTLTAVGGEPHVFAGVNDAPPLVRGRRHDRVQSGSRRNLGW